MPTRSKLKIVLVKDWLTSYGGSEEQLFQLHKLFPKAPIYTSVYDAKRLPQFNQADVREIPGSRWFRTGRRFEKLALLLPWYFSALKFEDYDLVISVTSGFAKAVRKGSSGTHICICNTPIRFAWNFGSDQRGLASRLLAPFFRWFDYWSAKRVDLFLANSNNVARRIKKVYGRESEVLYPPVLLDQYQTVKRSNKTFGYVTIGRLVGYKRVDLIIETFNKLHLPLTVIGTGPEEASLKSLAGPTIEMMGYRDIEVIKSKLAKAKAFIFAADEDFGIAPVEAIAAGCPVIAYGKGGSLETVSEGISGLFFQQQTVASLSKAVNEFPSKWDRQRMSDSISRFAVSQFKKSILQIVSRFSS